METRYAILHLLGREFDFKPGSLYGVGYTGTVDNPSGGARDAAWAVVAKHNRDDRPDGQESPSFSAGDIVVVFGKDSFRPTTEYASTGTDLTVVNDEIKWVIRPAKDCTAGDLKRYTNRVQYSVEHGEEYHDDEEALLHVAESQDWWVISKWISSLTNHERTHSTIQWNKVKRLIFDG